MKKNIFKDRYSPRSISLNWIDLREEDKSMNEQHCFGCISQFIVKNDIINKVEIYLCFEL